MPITPTMWSSRSRTGVLMTAHATRLAREEGLLFPLQAPPLGEHAPVVGAIFFGQGPRIEIEVGFADHVRLATADRFTEAPVGGDDAQGTCP